MEQSRSITRKSASNLALAFVLLPRAKRDAMCALYAFCREVDDVADEDTQPAELRAAKLGQWREDIRRACAGSQPQFAVNRELAPILHRYRLPFELFDQLIQGCEMDLTTHRYADRQALELYCYRVASVVGLLSIEIFGYRHPACRAYAVSLGQALQLTNILRDVQTDARRGRIYLPQSELARFGVTEAENPPRPLLRSLPSPGRVAGRSGQEFLSARAPRTAPGRAPGDGGRRGHGGRLLALAGPPGPRPFQRLRRASDPPDPAAQGLVDSADLA
jgi:hypothetical protein